MRNQILAGERLYLRPLETSDAASLAAFSAAETESFFDEGRVPHSPIALEHWITELHRRQPPRAIQLAVCLREDDKFIGMLGVSRLDWVNRTGESESYLGDVAARGKGYGPEAKWLLLEYIFDHLQLHVIRSFVWQPNWRSAAAVRHQGYREAGRLQTTATKHGVYQGEFVFDLLRDEYLAGRERWRAEQAGRKQRVTGAIGA